MKDYSSTLNLPKTEFSMKANLKEKEPQMIDYWEKIKIYELILEKNKNKEKFILHDGPPYANGPIHMGHALNKILKDIILKYKSMSGYFTPFIPGWDCHGLPIEHQLFKELGIDKNQISCSEFRKKAREYAQKYIDIQKQEFKRLGVFADWENPYITMSSEYEYHILKNLHRLFKLGYLYRRKKPVLWCINCETALADAEVEYEEKTSPSIYVKFKVKKSPLFLSQYKDTYILIWTTTPWTLPANLAVAFNPDGVYTLVFHKNQPFIVAENLCDIIFQKDYKKITSFMGKEVVKNTSNRNNDYIICEHPLMDKESIALADGTVALDEGTGIVHIAPGHGEEDYEIGLKYGLDIFCPVDEKGRFTSEIKFLEGINIEQANDIIIQKLQEKKLLFLKTEKIHSYPYCWRCKNPVIFRAAEQWFMSIDKNSLREKMLEEIEKVKWIPQYGKNRISSMVQSRPDWCLSRQRYWGVPISVIYCQKCKMPLLNDEIIQKFETLTKQYTTDVWFEDKHELIPKGLKCEKCGFDKFTKSEEIVDVWFDSGISYDAVLNVNPLLSFPADLYLEGSDQHRGWFQTSLTPSVALCDKAPYKSVLTHGFVVDGEGRKMSKSLGNVISPQEVINYYGADILRLWVAISDYSEDVRLSTEILKRLSEFYRKIRNTIRYLLANLYDFNYQENMLSYKDMLEIDIFALHKLNTFLKNIELDYQNYKFHKVIHALGEFCINFLSNFYFDVLKDRLYVYPAKSIERRSAQISLFYILDALVRVLAPIIPFTAEEAYQHMKHIKSINESLFLEDFPSCKQEFINEEVNAKWEKLLELRNKVNQKLEIQRQKKVIGSSLEAKVKISLIDENEYAFLSNYSAMLPMIFITSQVELKLIEGKEMIIEIEHADGEKCQRCWNFSTTVIDDICERCRKFLELT